MCIYVCKSSYISLILCARICCVRDYVHVHVWVHLFLLLLLQQMILYFRDNGSRQSALLLSQKHLLYFQ